jgi:hypothetical protein
MESLLEWPIFDRWFLQFSSDHLVFCLLSEYMKIEIHKIVLLLVVLCGPHSSGRIETGCVEGNIWT